MSGLDSDLIVGGGLRRSRALRFRPLVMVMIAVLAILFQVYVPRFIETLRYLELPLLVTIYFALMRRQPVAGTVIGCLVGLLQDTLSEQPLGMYGIAKTLVGYAAASVSQRFDLQNPWLRFVLCFLFFLFHQFLFWVLTRSLLGQDLPAGPAQTIIFAFLNAVVSVPLFLILDRLKEEGR